MSTLILDKAKENGGWNKDINLIMRSFMTFDIIVTVKLWIEKLKS